MFNNKSENNIISNRKVTRIEDIKDRYKGSLEKGDTVSILFAGVGGQGIILATTVLSHAALDEGFDVKVSEVHGMAQRGGSVIGSVRFGKKVYSPTVGKADFLVALEKLEALRYIGTLKEDGFLLASDYRICPTTVYLEGREYPKDIDARIGKVTKDYMIVDAISKAKQLKEIRSANMILLGMLSNFLPVSEGSWQRAIKEIVPERAVGVNLQAFDCGKKI